jgi:serine/threonine protein kinase
MLLDESDRSDPTSETTAAASSTKLPPHLRIQEPPLMVPWEDTFRAAIEQIIWLLGPLPSAFRKANHWSERLARISFPANQLLSNRLAEKGVDPELIDFISRLVELNPEKRLSAREGLHHDWIVRPSFGHLGLNGRDTGGDGRRRLMAEKVRSRRKRSAAASGGGHSARKKARLGRLSGKRSTATTSTNPQGSD